MKSELICAASLLQQRGHGCNLAACPVVEAVNRIHRSVTSMDDILDAILDAASLALPGTAVGLWRVEGSVMHPLALRHWPASLGTASEQHCAPCQTQIVLPLLTRDDADPLSRSGIVLRAVLSERAKVGAMHMLTLFMEHGSQATRRLGELAAAEHRTQALQSLHRISRTFVATLNLQDLYGTMFREIADRMPVDSFFVALYSPEEETIHMPFMYDDGSVLPPMSIPMNEGPTASVIRSKKPLLYNANAVGIEGVSLVGSTEKSVNCLMMVPIILSDRILGVLSVQSYVPDAYSQSDLQLLSMIANHAAISIENARLFGQTLQQATTDTMTGAMTRQSFMEKLQYKLNTATASGRRFSLLMFDADSLKSVNDQYGHHAGDMHLKALAEKLKISLRADDMLCRYGGDEFVVLLEGVDGDGAMSIARRIINDMLRSGFQVDGHILQFSASVGVAEFPTDGATRDELLAAADDAAYDAKRAGRGRVHRYSRRK